MQNKKTYIVLAIVVVVIAAAAYIGGRLLNGRAGPLGLFQLGDSGGPRSMAVNMTSAPELPATDPEARGNFVEQQDNIIIVATFSLEAGGGGVASGPGGGGRSASDDDSGPKVEVVVTSETVIYRDTTQFSPPSEASENLAIQQAVEEATLDELSSNSMVTVWGRKQGDRIIAEVLLIFTPVGGAAPQ
ncbi:MAG: hypothetical protein AB1649_08210 [Chloroflexota bacterium]